MIFIITEDGKFLTDESGLFLILDLASHFADVRKAYTAIPRIDEFTVLPGD